MSFKRANSFVSIFILSSSISFSCAKTETRSFVSRALPLAFSLDLLTAALFLDLFAEVPFIYYVSTFFCYINHNIFTNFLSIFLLLYVIKISNSSMKISSKCNVEKEILLFWRKNPVFVKNLEVNLGFVL